MVDDIIYQYMGYPSDLAGKATRRFIEHQSEITSKIISRINQNFKTIIYQHPRLYNVRNVVN